MKNKLELIIKFKKNYSKKINNMKILKNKILIWLMNQNNI